MASELQAMQSFRHQEEAVPFAIQGVGPSAEQKIVSEKRFRNTEHEALRLVLEGKGKITAKDIQQRIGRTREHTARMMNGLFQEGLVERNIAVRPFTYSITQKGTEALSS